MTLENLVGITLENLPADSLAIQKLVRSAQRSLEDAQLAKLSNEGRFDAAYRSIMQLAKAALQSQGYRVLTSRLGQHQTMLGTLKLTAGLPAEEIAVLDVLRRKRNAIDYSGDLVQDSMVAECIAKAQSLQKLVVKKVESHLQETNGN